MQTQVHTSMTDINNFINDLIDGRHLSKYTQEQYYKMLCQGLQNPDQITKDLAIHQVIQENPKYLERFLKEGYIQPDDLFSTLNLATVIHQW